MSRTSTLPKRLQPMLAALTDAPFDDPDWAFEDKYDGFRMIAEIKNGKVALYSRNGKIISRSYIEENESTRSHLKPFRESRCFVSAFPREPRRCCAKAEPKRSRTTSRKSPRRSPSG